MKQSAFFIFIYSSISLCAQCTLFSRHTEQMTDFNPLSNYTYDEIRCQSDNSETNISDQTFLISRSFYLIESIHETLVVPSPPVLTNSSAHLEVCEGNSTTLTATSDFPIEWYTSYPPEGEPVGRGSTLVTPPLSTGYYIYHAVANNQGVKSKSSEMEVVMVYPLPFINIVNQNNSICSGASATLSAYGTRYYSWSTGEIGNEIIIRPENTSTYKVTGINTAGCKNTKEFIQEVENCGAYTEVSFSDKVNESSQVSESVSKDWKSTIYPNPNTGEFHVKLNSVSENSRIELYNSYGDLIYKTNVLDELTTINISNHTRGIYTLRILEAEKMLTQEKVVIE